MNEHFRNATKICIGGMTFFLQISPPPDPNRAEGHTQPFNGPLALYGTPAGLTSSMQITSGRIDLDSGGPGSSVFDC